MFNDQSVHLEISSKCTLKCPRCPRTELEPGNINQELDLQDFQTGFPKDQISKIQNFIFCGDIGDPIYATNFLEIINYVKTYSKARVKIITNGSYKKSEWWQQLASNLDRNDQVTFSVDGWDNRSNNQYRINSDFDSIVQGIKTLRSVSDCVIQWSTIYFEFNQSHIDQIRTLARSLGCNRFQTVKSSKFDHQYAVNQIDLLKPRTDLVARTAVYEFEVEQLNPDKYEDIPVAVPIRSHPWAKCLNYKKELFVSVDGLVMPCAWFNSEYHYNNFVKRHKQNISIKHRSFFDIIEDHTVWQDLVMSFDTEPFEICKLKCKNAQQ